MNAGYNQARAHVGDLKTHLQADRIAKLRSPSATVGHPLPLTATAAAGDLDPLAWLHRQPAGRRGYWASRDGALEVAATGVALRITARSGNDIDAAYHHISYILDVVDDNSICFLGGQAFDPSWPSDALWSAFPALEYVLPKVIMRRRGSQTTVTVCAAIDAASEAAIDAASLDAELAAALNASLNPPLGFHSELRPVSRRHSGPPAVGSRHHRRAGSDLAARVPKGGHDPPKSIRF